jgi:hypothetical protein
MTAVKFDYFRRIVQGTSQEEVRNESRKQIGVNIHGSVHRDNTLLYKSQEDAHVTEFILPDNCPKHVEQSSGKIISVTCASCCDLYSRNWCYCISDSV